MRDHAPFAALQAEMTAWRRDFHQHPELAFAEHRTADRVAELLGGWGIEVHRGLGGTGVVGRLEGRSGSRTVGLRADMDALAMDEATGLSYASTHPGVHHACGHDGHLAMLLGAARHLSEARDFDGVVHFIFQPAEEGRGGGREMVEDGLFERFPCDSIYALHNWPALPRGHVAVRPGPMMASSDAIDIVLRGRGGHGAMPHQCADPVVGAAALVTALQTLVSRQVDPTDTAVVSVTRLDAGSAFNVIPDTARLRGTVRAVRPETRDAVEAAVHRCAEGIARAHGLEAEVVYTRSYPATVNHPERALRAAQLAAEVVGADCVRGDLPPSMGAEDFSFMLEACPGAYLWLGQGGHEARPLHSPRYDFDDAVLPVGARLLATLATRG